MLHAVCDAHAEDAACFAERGVESLDVIVCVCVYWDIVMPALNRWSVLPAVCDAHAEDAACFAGRGVESLTWLCVCVYLDLVMPALNRA